MNTKYQPVSKALTAQSLISPIFASIFQHWTQSLSTYRLITVYLNFETTLNYPTHLLTRKWFLVICDFLILKVKWQMNFHFDFQIHPIYKLILHFGICRTTVHFKTIYSVSLNSLAVRIWGQLLPSISQLLPAYLNSARKFDLNVPSK